MTRHKSAIKAHKQSLKKALRNKAEKNRIKTYTKKVEHLIDLKDIKATRSALSAVESIVMKAVTKKVLKLRTASRKIMKLNNRIRSLEKETSQSL